MTDFYRWDLTATSPLYTDTTTVTSAWDPLGESPFRREPRPQNFNPKFKTGDLVRLTRESLGMGANGTTLVVKTYSSLDGHPRVNVATLAPNHRVPMTGGGSLNQFFAREEDLEYV